MNAPPTAEQSPERQAVTVSYEHSQSLPALLEQLDLSVLLSTYQAGRVVSVGSHRGELRLGFSRFDQAMGLCRTASGIAVGSRDAIWTLPASREIAPRIKPEGEHDIAFLARSCHHSGPLMGHDLAWANGRLWLVNTLFNGLVTIEGHWLELCAPVAAALHQRLGGRRSLPPQRPGVGGRRQRAGLCDGSG